MDWPIEGDNVVQWEGPHSWSWKTDSNPASATSGRSLSSPGVEDNTSTSIHLMRLG